MGLWREGSFIYFVTFTIHYQGLSMENELTFFLKDTHTHTHTNSSAAIHYVSLLLWAALNALYKMSWCVIIPSTGFFMYWKVTAVIQQLVLTWILLDPHSSEINWKQTLVFLDLSRFEYLFILCSLCADNSPVHIVRILYCVGYYFGWKREDGSTETESMFLSWYSWKKEKNKMSQKRHRV